MLAELGAHGLVRASFVPPEPIRELRDLTRARATFARERTREIQRLEKLLEDAGLKLSSVATQITGVSSRAMLSALIAGERDPAVLADLDRVIGRLYTNLHAASACSIIRRLWLSHVSTLVVTPVRACEESNA